MRKVFLIVGSLLLLFVIALILIPIIFKDDIKSLAKKKLNEELNATIYFDDSRFSLSLLKHFPNLTLSTGNMGVVGVGEFQGDTLVHFDDLGVEIDLLSILFSKKVQIEGIDAVKPRIQVKVLADGKANYDIVPPSEEKPGEGDAATDTAKSDMTVSIKYWNITDGYLVYDDRSLNFFMKLEGLQHKGKGDFAAAVFDMVTKTESSAVTMSYEDMTYFERVKFVADLTMGIDMSTPDMVLTFKDNKSLINDFAFVFGGKFVYAADRMDFDMNMNSQESSFKDLLSMAPAAYLKDFENLKAEGTVSLEALLKGSYTETTMPGIKLGLNIKDGKMGYPGLPSEIADIQANIMVDALDGNYDNMLLDISMFHLRMGNNPVDGKIKVKGLTNYVLDADVAASLNLAEISSFYPMEGTELKGKFDFRVKANGSYDSAAKRIPTIDAVMKLTDGLVKSKDYNVPIEQINFSAKAVNTTGNMADFKMDLEQAALMMDGKPLTAKGSVQNLDDPAYTFDLDGSLDLGTVDKIMPEEGRKLAGQIAAKISTKGKMSDIEASRYANLPTSGALTIKGLQYASKDMPQGIRIDDCQLNFTPKEIVLAQYKGFLGQSDVDLKGKITNYLSYLLKDETVAGQFTLTSQKFNTNEWMVTEEGEPLPPQPQGTPTGGGEESYGVVALPDGIDFRFDAKITELLYEKFVLNNLNGGVHLKDGMLKLDNFKFESYGGQFGMNGTYDPRNLKDPKFDFDFGIQNLQIVQAYQNYSSVQAMVPIAKNVDGKFSTLFSLKGSLGEDLMPVPASLSGVGRIGIKEAMFKKDELIMASIARLSEVADMKEAKLKDIDASVTVENGRLNVSPTKMKFGEFDGTFGGTTGLDGSLDFAVQMMIPKSKLPAQVALMVSKVYPGDKVPFNFKVGGNYANPVVGLDKSEWGNAVKEEVKEKIEEVKDQAIEDAKETAKETAKDAAKDAANKWLGTGKDTTKTDTAKTTKPTQKTIEEGKKKLEDLKKKFPFGNKN